MKKYNIFTDVEGGDLIPIEFFDLPFTPKRIFTVNNVPQNSIRGNHAHYETEQLLICINGSILVGTDDGNKREEIILNRGESRLVKKMVWDWQKFLTNNDFLLVLSSTKYDKKDYIEDLDEFYKLTRK